jgi:predicted phosphodiesterase
LIGIVSDIHANLAALTAVFARLDELEVSTVICLGDTAGYYDRINECCALLREREVFSIMGNHDRYLADDGLCARSKSATRSLQYQLGVVEPVHRDWLRSLSSGAVVDKVLDVVHGGWNHRLEEYMTPSDEYFLDLSGPFFASGHTHVPVVWTNGVKTYCNPGSVGQPRDGDPRASFATWDHSSFQIHRVEYDVRDTQRSMARAGFEPYFFENLARGLRIGATQTMPAQ